MTTKEQTTIEDYYNLIPIDLQSAFKSRFEEIIQIDFKSPLTVTLREYCQEALATAFYDRWEELVFNTSNALWAETMKQLPQEMQKSLTQAFEGICEGIFGINFVQHIGLLTPLTGEYV